MIAMKSVNSDDLTLVENVEEKNENQSIAAGFDDPRSPFTSFQFQNYEMRPNNSNNNTKWHGIC